jgi:hypothetical protein
VAAAFAAQEKLNIAQNLSNSAAITKSEGSTTKELQSLNEKIESLKQIFQSDVRNLEGRLNRGEGGVSGARDTRVDHRAEVGQALLIAGVLVSIAIGLAPLVFGQRPGATPQVVYLPAPAAAGAIVAAPKP